MLALPVVLTHNQANQCLAALVRALDKAPAQVELDVGALQDFDSSALAVLLELRRACLRVGKELRIVAASQRLMHLAALYGVGSLLSFAASGSTSSS